MKNWIGAQIVLLVLLSMAFTAQSCSHAPVDRDLARVQSKTTPFDAIKTRLTLKKGDTFLNFMMKSVKPALDAYDKDIRELAEKYPNRYSKWQEDLIAAGKGVAIRIDSQNYFFNIGYTDGSQEGDIKSGRSYGVGPTHRQSDPSDRFYLNELHDYLQSEPDAIDDFVRAIMLVLTDCDASGWGKLSVKGQMVATDFLAIYTAESDRHLMVNLEKGVHPWEIDLAAATFASVFVTKTGLIMQNGKLVEGKPEMWWAQGNTGSGIGNTRRDRKKLQALFGQFAKTNKKHAELIKAIEKVTGKLYAQDVIQGVFEYLNKPPKGPGKVDATELTQLVVNYITKIGQDANEIRNSFQ